MDNRWQWTALVDRIVQKHFISPDQVYEMNFIDFCNWLSYYKEQDEYIQAIQNKNTMTT